MTRIILCCLCFLLFAAPAFAAKPPTITGVTATNVTSSGVIVTWTTNLPATSQVEFGTTTHYGSSTPVDNTLITTHAVELTTLAPQTTYHYRVKSQPSPGAASVVSADYTFKTLALPPIGYVLQFWDTPSGGVMFPGRMNNLGQVTGYYSDLNGFYRGYLYDASISPDMAIDLETVYGAPAGWRISGASKVNDHGVIVGTLVPVEQAGHTPIRQGFILDTRSASPTVAMMPNWGAWTFNYPADINENGDIFGTYRSPDGSYHAWVVNSANLGSPQYLAAPISPGSYPGFLNNPSATRPAQVAGFLADGNGSPIRWTIGVGLESFSVHAPFVSGINDSGTICGGATLTTTSTTVYPMRLTTPTPQFLTGPGTANTNAKAINNAGDTLTNTGLLYRDDWTAYGKYADVNKLLIASSADKTIWYSGSIVWSHLNDRGDITNAGQIAGRWSNGNYMRGFLLTPIAP